MFSAIGVLKDVHVICQKIRTSNTYNCILTKYIQIGVIFYVLFFHNYGYIHRHYSNNCAEWEHPEERGPQPNIRELFPGSEDHHHRQQQQQQQQPPSTQEPTGVPTPPGRNKERQDPEPEARHLPAEDD